MSLLECREPGSRQPSIEHQCELANVWQPRLHTMARDSLDLSNNVFHVQEIATITNSLDTAQELNLYD